MMVSEQLKVQTIKDILASFSDLDQEISVILHQSLPSTNDYLMRQIISNNKPSHKTAVLAEIQTAGKGRLDRVWISPPGNIYLSFYWQFKHKLDELYDLSLVIGIAVARVLKANGLHDVKLKWPNDIFWNEGKLGGILIETKQNKGMVDAVIGIGLNVQSMHEHDAEISQRHIDLQSALQQKINRNKLVAQLLNELNDVLMQFSTSGFNYFQNEWKQYEIVLERDLCTV
jgi:BirA family biotin operon repressor/biotin-[acetyl-CoA-carboxylase] ligase